MWIFLVLEEGNQPGWTCLATDLHWWEEPWHYPQCTIKTFGKQDIYNMYNHNNYSLLKSSRVLISYRSENVLCPCTILALNPCPLFPCSLILHFSFIPTSFGLLCYFPYSIVFWNSFSLHAITMLTWPLLSRVFFWLARTKFFWCDLARTIKHFKKRNCFLILFQVLTWQPPGIR